MEEALRFWPAAKSGREDGPGYPWAMFTLSRPFLSYSSSKLQFEFPQFLNISLDILHNVATFYFSVKKILGSE